MIFTFVHIFRPVLGLFLSLNAHAYPYISILVSADDTHKQYICIHHTHDHTDDSTFGELLFLRRYLGYLLEGTKVRRYEGTKVSVAVRSDEQR